MTTTEGERTTLNHSVLKAISLLRAASEDSNANVSSLARSAGLPRATALRLIQTLEHEGFLLRTTGDDRVMLGPGLLSLARSSSPQQLLQDAARPVITELVASIRETVTLSVVSHDGGLDLVDQVDAPHQLRPRSWLGQRFPLHCSASGKILLSALDDASVEARLQEPLTRFTPATITQVDVLRAELARVREQRYAVASDEEEEGLTGVGAGIFSSAGELLGVVTAAGPTQRLDRLRGQEAIARLVAAARQIETSVH